MFSKSARNQSNANMMTDLETQSWLKDRILVLESKLAALESKYDDGWMPLEAASKKLGKSVAAIRQRIKSKTKPMPEGNVWKQEAKGYEIFVHLKNFRAWL
ncbi:hypothetical protein L2729_11760 [Shewanella gelidimarina]|uniref:hypothetical protein n=1 Tax=Shewanella gelidimarina TaxID=56813 RepID=UPI0020102C3D|nr:hypothetical protein [Shewanella gelidimarina]MCL1058662.1 hypothetical protein [Shewanella gelidimarina]